MQELSVLQSYLSTPELRTERTVFDALNERITALSLTTKYDLPKRLWGIYSEDDCAFILSMCKRSERICLGFEYFTLLHPSQRIDAADAVTDLQLRSGWFNIGVPARGVPTIYRHENQAVGIASDMYADDPELPFLQFMMRYHDCIEGVSGDITPHCGINRSDKKRIERLIIHLLTETRPSDAHAKKVFQSFMVFEGYVPEKARLQVKGKDCDLISMVVEAAEIRHAYPDRDFLKTFRARHNKARFVQTITSGLKTPRAKMVYKVMANPQYHGKDPEKIRNKALGYMLRQDPAYATWLMSGAKPA